MKLIAQFKKIITYFFIRLSSTNILIFISFFISLLGYTITITEFDEQAIDSRALFAAYVPFFMWGIFVYLLITRILAYRLRYSNRVWSIFLFLWLIIGGWICYILSLTCNFLLFYLNANFKYLAWIPVDSFLISEICYTSILFAAIFNFLLILAFYVRDNETS